MTVAAETGKRRRGRAAKRHRKPEAAFDAAWRCWRNPYPPIEQFNAAEIEAIHTASMQVLADVGVRVLSEEARRIYVAAGMTDAGEQVVRFDPDLVEALVSNTPSETTLYGRGDSRNVTIGGKMVGVCTTGGTPNFSDARNGRRPGSLAALDDLCRVAQAFDVIHMIGPFVEAQDIPPNLRHLAMTRSVLTLTDKVPFVFFRGTQAVADAYEMIRIAHDLTQEAFVETPVSYSVANSNSPLQLDHLMCRGIIDAARAGQLMVLTPFTLAGAMAPVTLAGALTLQNAEALAGICLSQIVRPGAPVCYGSFTTNVDMKTGAPAFGTPEYTKAAFASGQLARRYKIPLRSSAVTTSNAPDAQAAYENQMSLWGALMGGTNLLLHGAGWLEGGLTASAEKFIIDVEQLQMFAELFKPVEVSEQTLGLEAIGDVGHGGHYFGTQHTLDRFEAAFYSPLLSDWSNYENWVERGALTATDRAHRIFCETVNAHEPPAMDASRLEELDDFIARRTAEGGANLDR
ncbi:Trimethylamine methyltransferase (MTTB) [Roseovarius sp. THAF27]|uniref:trimethylamine methyltransferase family protein n=1 Tax=Roseovarius sp. THAF27 TaxID=2587850 RepID=UPI001267E756|nr:trimethylamine methyltransferase family protein [Roseovarius sp. THAF27]QFT82403.1 Trimethylamine methyltransferase (MTTB) [Roseovarius sp. THAF27]